MNNPVWKFLTSLRLTVVLLTLGLVVVFLGTLAQVHEGLWNAQDRWFRSFFVIRHGNDPWWVPPIFPGGYFLGVALLLNLIAAHIKRFQWSNKKMGIHLTHLGIILLLVGQLATDMLSLETNIQFREGETRSYSEAPRANELVFATDAENGQEKVVSVPEAVVAQKGEISEGELPFTVRVKDYSINGNVLSQAEVQEASTKLTSAMATLESQFSSADAIVPQAERAVESEGRASVWRAALLAVGEKETGDLVAAARRVAADASREAKFRQELKTRFQNEMLRGFEQQAGAMRYVAQQKRAGKETLEPLAPASSKGAGEQYSAIRLPEAKDMNSRNMPFAIVEIVPKNGQSLGTWLVSPFLNPQSIEVGGKTYRTAFRFERYYFPFSVTLLKTTHEVYPGTMLPKNYQSRVRINNPQTGEAREVDIYMNNPLRYAGFAFYQSQMDRFTDPGFSGLQVVRNPSWLTPYLGCIIVGFGMTWQFMYHLLGFMRKRRTPEPTPAKSRKEKEKRSPSLAKA